MRTVSGLGLMLLAAVLLAGCGRVQASAVVTAVAAAPSSTLTPSATVTATATATVTPTVTPTPTITLTPSATPFPIGQELTIDWLRTQEIVGSEITFEQTLANGPSYYQYVASYISEGNRIYGLLTIPFGAVPEGGFKAIVFNHGYIPPNAYQTTARYEAYVDSLARAGFVVFKIDMRGHGNSEGVATGSYFSPAYTIDAISALKSLQTLDYVDPQGIGMWGHSMAGNLTMRAMLLEPDIQAGVIWAGAVYSYVDFATYAISDPSFRPQPTPTGGPTGTETPIRRSRQFFELYGNPSLESDFWQAVSLTANVDYLNAPLQLHHAVDDDVVDIGYSRDLAAVLLSAGKLYEFYTYEGGGHNIISPFFGPAMQRTIQFFRDHL